MTDRWTIAISDDFSFEIEPVRVSLAFGPSNADLNGSYRSKEEALISFIAARELARTHLNASLARAKRMLRRARKGKP